MKPKAGQSITAKWARDLQNMQDASVPLGGIKTSVGISQASSLSLRKPVYALNGATKLEPYSLIGLKQHTAQPTYDGRIHLLTTKGRADLLVTNGDQTVPAGGLFLPIWPDENPRMYKVADPAKTYIPGTPCGRVKDGVLLSHREGGLIALTDANDEDYVWAIKDTQLTWDGYCCGAFVTTTNALTSILGGAVGFIINDALSNARADVYTRQKMSMIDGTYVIVHFSDRWRVVWADCDPSTLLDNQAGSP